VTGEVFISYAHDGDQHVEAVRQFWQLLRAHGVDARLDVGATPGRQDWPVWMMSELRQADFVIVVASPAYRKRAEGQAAPDEGRGVQFEGALLRELLYADRQKWFSRILPVILPGQSRDGIPIFLSPVSGSVYRVTELTSAGVQPLLTVLTGRSQPAPVPQPAPVAGHRSKVAGLADLAAALGQIPEFDDATARQQVLRMLEPEIRQHIESAPTTRMHLIAIVRGCARFGEPGRTALLDLLRSVLPQGDPAVRAAISAVQTSPLFGDPGPAGS
jgi:hypothetical protein